MSGVLDIVIYVVMAGVFVVLAAGVVSMIRGGKKSNVLMRWRIGLQALSIILLLILVFVVRD